MAKWLITGGAGFIGTNLALELVSRGEEMVLIDDLSRDGSLENAQLLSKSGCTVYEISIVDKQALGQAIAQNPGINKVVHLAGQVSLMASISDPVHDFMVNALGTLNLLELVRENLPSARFLFSSTNKVYGDLGHLDLNETSLRYKPAEKTTGLGINQPLDFHGGYGVSKGCADQYVIDYHRIYGIDTVTLRQSAICGRFQHPKADQGWASFLVRETLAGRRVSLNGFGKQVRDLLDVEDLVDLYITVMTTPTIKKRVYNVGGGPFRSLSLLELFVELERRGYGIDYEVGPFRPSDQMYFVADVNPLAEDFGWQPKYGLGEIIDRLVANELQISANQDSSM